jgi:threonyl-tRNA synthetase
MDYLLPNGDTLTLPAGANGADAAAAIGPGLAKAALAIKVDGVSFDLSRPLPTTGEGRVEIITEKSGEEALELIRHDAAHVFAEAMLELYPGVQISIGPPIENGFYYDLDLPEGVTLNEDDFPVIEARMREHIEADEEFVREDVPVAVALDRYRGEGQSYKVELIEDLLRNAPPQAPLTTVSLYTNGAFVDLCRGPHAPTTKRIKAFKLQSVAGAYWRGNSDNKMLTRVYGTAFFSNKDLEDYLARLELARENDHRKLGRELEMFLFSEHSPGSPFWQPNGMAVWNALSEFWREQNGQRGYREVKTPILFDVELWKQSGHWEKYQDNMYFTEVEDRPMGLKPMNCPGHILIYSATRRSYRDLPIRFSEQGLVHRHEPSGTLHGLLRVRHITQDDAHIFCTEEQVEDEVLGCLEFGAFIYRTFGFEPKLELSTRPDKRIGTDEMWDHAESSLLRALERRDLKYDVNEGDGAFYGPKIDLHMTDSIGRSWQLGTVQLDYSMPERFGITYTGEDNAEHRPVMIHRALFGSFERFIGILTEHFHGEFPVWMAPVQVLVVPIADRHNLYGAAVRDRLAELNIRVELDDRTESVGRKIRDAEVRKVPFMLVVGDREQEAGEVGVREHRAGDTGAVALDDFLARISDLINTRSLT